MSKSLYLAWMRIPPWTSHKQFVEHAVPELRAWVAEMELADVAMVWGATYPGSPLNTDLEEFLADTVTWETLQEGCEDPEGLLEYCRDCLNSGIEVWADTGVHEVGDNLCIGGDSYGDGPIDGWDAAFLVLEIPRLREIITETCPPDEESHLLVQEMCAEVTAAGGWPAVAEVLSVSETDLLGGLWVDGPTRLSLARAALYIARNNNNPGVQQP